MEQQNINPNILMLASCWHLLGRPEEDCTPVDVLPIRLGHGLGPGLGRKDALVAVVLQLRFEKVEELVRLDLLQADDVGRVVSDLVQDCLRRMRRK